MGALDFVVKRPNFKIVNEENKKLITVYFDRQFIDDVVNHVKKLSNVNVTQVSQDRGIGQTEVIEYHLISFVDD
ncbi:hypothetical protein [Methanobacterium petrolearium]|uniref:hypothetical protein n=1 Tax=Methanobacterium petrolearium TaxID=710190 RepID=UPI001AE4A4BC|nr:hypothetical protein [Methanobacterium petrolearium]MBP1945752.1 hypothetical protein [Methanobacterium petrolearium]BDZ71999.1 hypothetical protein GCM10025861_25160 [Methanobacterium petrolearium]